MKALLKIPFLNFLLLTSKIYASPNLNPLLKFVLDSQIEDHSLDYYNGGWPVMVSANSNSPQGGLEETNIFIPLQLLLSLSQVHKESPLKEFSLLAHRFNPMFEKYLMDTIQSNRPWGSINFWPRLTLPNGSQVFHFTQDENLIAFTGIPSLNHDFDDSAHAVLWILEQNLPYASFVSSFLNLVGKYRDMDRTPYLFENSYKGKNSGTFLTWIWFGPVNPRS